MWMVALTSLYSLTAEAAGELELIPVTGSFAVGDTFAVAVQVHTPEVPIHAVEADISFNPAVFSVEEISTEGTFLVSWATAPTFSNEKGTITFSGWSDVYSTHEHATALTIRFKAKQEAESAVRIDGGALLAADGQSTNALSSLRSGLYTVSVPEVLPTPQPGVVAGVATSQNEETFLGTTSVPLSEDISGDREMSAPELIDVPEALNVGERLILQGKTEPLAEVFLWVSKDGGEPRRFSVLSTAEGNFTFVSEDPVRAGEGTYRVYAETRAADGVQSPYSNVHVFTVGEIRLGSAAAVSAALSGAGPWVLLGTALTMILFMFFMWARGRKQVPSE